MDTTSIFNQHKRSLDKSNKCIFVNTYTHPENKFTVSKSYKESCSHIHSQTTLPSPCLLPRRICVRDIHLSRVSLKIPFLLSYQFTNEAQVLPTALDFSLSHFQWTSLTFPHSNQLLFRMWYKMHFLFPWPIQLQISSPVSENDQVSK